MSGPARIHTVISGNFDFVPASASAPSLPAAAPPRPIASPPPAVASISVEDQLEWLRRRLRQDREAEQPRRPEQPRRDYARSAWLQAWDARLARAMSSPPPNPRRRARLALHRTAADQPQPAADAPDDPDDPASVPALEARFSYMTPFSRTRALRAMRFASLQNARRRGRQSNNMANDEMASLSELYDATDRLAQVNEDLRSVIPPPQRSRNHARQPTPTDANEARRKRPRLDMQAPRDTQPRIAYGYEGQVVAGKLNMQLVSTDSGMLDATQLGPDHASTSSGKYAATNVLRDDSSVYCTLSSRCNMILRHQGQTAFTLEKLIIRAPRQGFTDPVQEGLVFVSMKRDDAFERTAQYHIYHFPSSRFGRYFATARHRHDSRTNLRLPSFNSLTADVTWPTLQRAMDLHRAEHDAESDGDDDDADEQSVDLAVTRSINVSTMDENFPRDWLFTGSLDETDDATSPPQTLGTAQAEYQDMLAQQDFDEVLRRGAATSEDRRRRGQAAWTTLGSLNRSNARARERAARGPIVAPSGPAGGLESNADTAWHTPDPDELSDMDEDDSSDELPDIGPNILNDASLDTTLMEPNARFSMIARGELRMRGRRHVTRHLKRIEASFDEPQAGDGSLSQPAHYTINRTGDRTGLPTSAVGDVMHDTIDGRRVTLRHVRTTSTIQSDNKIAIKFDPPISARFILLKLWNPKSNDGRSDGTGNIDIEAVQAYGWAGPQFFPATDMR